MAIDSLNSLTNEQLLAMQMQSNGQLTSSNSSSNINESDLAFQNVLKDYMSKAGVSTEGTNNDGGLSTEQLLALSLQSNGQLTLNDDGESSREMSDQMNLTNLLAMQQLQKAANNQTSADSSKKTVSQDCPTGQDLERLAMRINGYSANYVNYSRTSNVPAADMAKIKEAVKQASKKYGVDENLIMAIIKQESNFNSNAVSGAGAMGLMQVMPANFSSVGITDPYDVTQNVNGGTKILKQALDQFNGDISLALMAYNAGAGNMQRRGVTTASDLYKMPKETQNYVPSVLGYYRKGVN